MSTSNLYYWKCVSSSQHYCCEYILVYFLLFTSVLTSLQILVFANVFDVQCSTVSNCSNITGNVTCDLSSGKCSCAEGHVRMNMHHHCLPYVSMGEYCSENAQCTKIDPNVICSRWRQRCQCIAGYHHEKLENSSVKMCLKSPVSESEPYFVHIFSGLDPVHIALGCLTGGLALLACFAGILQLLRKKWSRPGCSNDRFSPDLGYSTTSAPSQSQPYSDSQFASPCIGFAHLGDFACLDGNSTAPPTPGSIGDKDYIVTPPPTYEEALQQSEPIRKTGSTTTV